MIPSEILSKHGIVDSLEERLEVTRELGFDDKSATIEYYESFLIQTDYLIFKLIEGSISSADCAEELKYREIARQEIATISGQPYEPRENQKTLDERTAILEEEGLEATIDHECRIALLELGVTEL